jgi:hypothetical protein
MPIADKVLKYSVAVLHNNVLDESRQLRLSLVSGGTATITFVDSLPSDWLQFFASSTSLYLRAEQFADTYHLLQSEAPTFFTALDIFGIKVGSVHTELDLSAGEPPGEGEHDAQSLPALIRQARQLGVDRR